MKCKQIRSLIYNYEDGATDEVTRSAIESHLSGCAACRLHYETQRRLHRSMASAVSSELAGLHFKPMPIKEGPSVERRPSLDMWPRRMALAASCILVLCITTWVLWKPVPKLASDPVPSAYAEAYHYLDMCRADSPGKSNFAAPLAVIIRPGVPARIVELDGTTDISDALK
jgi:predicted anti-sigma-YlaC factor YlaD